MRGLWQTSLLISVALLIGLLGAGCGDNGDFTPKSTSLTPAPPMATGVSSSTIGPTTVLSDFGVGCQQVYRLFKGSGIDLLPLSEHTSEWYSTMTPNADIMIDIFGPSDAVNAIETTFRLNAATASMIDLVTTEMLQVALGHAWGTGEVWIINEMENLSDSRPKIQTRMSDVYLTLYWRPSSKSVMFTVDVEKH